MPETTQGTGNTVVNKAEKKTTTSCPDRTYSVMGQLEITTVCKHIISLQIVISAKKEINIIMIYQREGSLFRLIKKGLFEKVIFGLNENELDFQRAREKYSRQRER